MSDDKKIPGPPPDDFSKTTPNIKLPSDITDGQNDWDKTNYNFPKQPVADDWGKTVTSLRPIDIEGDDFGKNLFPTPNRNTENDWMVSHPDADRASTDFGSEFGAVAEKTTPYFKLPDAERAKYQNLPPTPTEKAEQEQKERDAKGEIPGWIWAVLGIIAMFFFACLVLLVVWFIILRPTNFSVVVRNAPMGSNVFVDNVQWGVTDGTGSRELQNLKAGRRTITIEHPSWTCQPLDIVGVAGVTPDPIPAQCVQKPVQAGENCTSINLGEEDKAERCYNDALDKLPNPFTTEALVAALNILIINFESGKFDIPPRRLAALKKGSDFIKKLPPEVVLEVGGHTDNVGNDASNQTLSDNRANAVKQALVGFGVRGEALQTRGYGAAKPKANNATEQGRFYNRRIEYSIVKK